MKKLNKYHFGFLMASLSVYVGSADACSSNDVPSGSSSASTKKDPIQEKGEKMVEEVDGLIEKIKQKVDEINDEKRIIESSKQSVIEKAPGSTEEKLNNFILYQNSVIYKNGEPILNPNKFLTIKISENSNIDVIKSAGKKLKDLEEEHKKIQEKLEKIKENFKKVENKQSKKATDLVSEYESLDIDRRSLEQKLELEEKNTIIIIKKYLSLNFLYNKIKNATDEIKKSSQYKTDIDKYDKDKTELNAQESDMEDFEKTMNILFDDSPFDQGFKNAFKDFNESLAKFNKNIKTFIDTKNKLIKTLNDNLDIAKDELENSCKFAKKEIQASLEYLKSLINRKEFKSSDDLYKKIIEKLKENKESKDFKNLSIEFSKFQMASPYLSVLVYLESN